jgi:Tfp pilus assembly protein PilN
VIEVNLLPGAARRGARRGAKASGSRRSKGTPKVDRLLLAIIGAWVLGLGVAGWLHLKSADQRQEVELAIAQAVQDSVRYNTIIVQLDKLRARRDTIAHKLVLIQELDAGRYVWAHLIDEISRVLPDYTWLTQVAAADDDGAGRAAFQITGRTGNTFALTRFLKDLEASPFITGVQLTRTELVRDQSQRTVHEFVVMARYEEPPVELLTTVPLEIGDD